MWKRVAKPWKYEQWECMGKHHSICQATANHQVYPMTSAILGWRKGNRSLSGSATGLRGDSPPLGQIPTDFTCTIFKIRSRDKSKNRCPCAIHTSFNSLVPAPVFTQHTVSWRLAPAPTHWSLCGSPMAISSYYHLCAWHRFSPNCWINKFIMQPTEVANSLCWCTWILCSKNGYLTIYVVFNFEKVLLYAQTCYFFELITIPFN